MLQESVVFPTPPLLLKNAILFMPSAPSRAWPLNEERTAEGDSIHYCDSEMLRRRNMARPAFGAFLSHGRALRRAFLVAFALLVVVGNDWGVVGLGGGSGLEI